MSASGRLYGMAPTCQGARLHHKVRPVRGIVREMTSQAIAHVAPAASSDSAALRLTNNPVSKGDYL
jgi:hypothetical protein